MEAIGVEEKPGHVLDVSNSKKEYSCKYCGAGPFEKPWQVASHSRKCPEAIEARKKEKDNEQSASDNN